MARVLRPDNPEPSLVATREEVGLLTGIARNVRARNPWPSLACRFRCVCRCGPQEEGKGHARRRVPNDEHRRGAHVLPAIQFGIRITDVHMIR